MLPFLDSKLKFSKIRHRQAAFCYDKEKFLE
ncbi:hypothetical protein SAMN04488695_1106 [Proteiniclasticum ruminis]|uniref:Uncharacterized protein n=1 Tax=Proteiniclasticum ruminis TaxID=398199 RepID=A0A1I5DLY9_9CLOT|nr:hypothetical protein SAMN04488695_1106 [Proteiniclasticum ruminis]